MDTLFSPIREFFKKGDWVLLLLCLLASGYGLILIYSATRYMESNRSVIVQGAAVLIGVVVYIILTFVDFQSLTEKCWKQLMIFSIFFVMLVRTPIGIEMYGNRNWIRIPGIPFTIQPDEVVKIFLILMLARVISRLQEQELNISTVPCIIHMAAPVVLMIGVVAVACGDMGMCVIYMFIFATMTWAAGVKKRWFFVTGGGAVGSVVFLWSFVLPKTSLWDNYRIARFRVVFDHTYDAAGYGYQQNRSLLAIGSGQITGQGFLNGTQTQSSFSQSLPVRESDFIFAVCGEEFGMIGCILLLGILSLIILRCIWIGQHADSKFSAYVALGAAGMLMAQIFINVGMNLFVVPVMGLTLPFFSNGGSSMVTMFAAMGVVSSVKAQALPSWLKDKNRI